MRMRAVGPESDSNSNLFHESGNSFSGFMKKSPKVITPLLNTQKPLSPHPRNLLSLDAAGAKYCTPTDDPRFGKVSGFPELPELP